MKVELYYSGMRSERLRGHFTTNTGNVQSKRTCKRSRIVSRSTSLKDVTLKEV